MKRLSIIQVWVSCYNEQRTVRVHLPDEYYSDTRSYPVLYMHNGQNVLWIKQQPMIVPYG
ncbi:MAG: hypothetical protein IJA10_11875 [Lachnospiraceae bacterium]|nr:hypothetical protein [Lachnospiraceae bacterium]